MRRLFLGLLASLLVFLGLSGFAIWQDGRRFALVGEASPPVPDGVAQASYLDASRLDWKTADELREYAREHRLGLIDRIEGNPTP